MPESDPVVQASCVLSGALKRLGVAIEGQDASTSIKSLRDSARMARHPGGTVHVSAIRSDCQVSEGFVEQNGDMVHFSIDVEP